MSSYKVNYSELVDALQEHNRGQANALIEGLLPRLKTYLKTVMNASANDAEEAVHQAFYNVYEKILQDRIINEKYLYKYLLKACRYEYLKIVKHSQRFIGEDQGGFQEEATPAQQIENLLDKDRQEILKICLQQLPDESRAYITYIMNHPDASTKGLSERFNISEANVRVKKTRIISELSKCVKMKMNQ